MLRRRLGPLLVERTRVPLGRVVVLPSVAAGRRCRDGSNSQPECVSRHRCHPRLIRGASPLGLPDTRPRSPLRRLAPGAWLARNARSRWDARPVYQIASALSEGLRPSDSPTRALARRSAGSRRSRGSLACSLARCDSFSSYPRGFAPRTPRHAPSLAAPPAPAGRVGAPLRSRSPVPHPDPLSAPSLAAARSAFGAMAGCRFIR